MRPVRRTPGRPGQTRSVATYPRVSAGPSRIRAGGPRPSGAGSCFICAIVAGERDDHFVLFRDDTCIVFFAKVADTARRHARRTDRAPHRCRRQLLRKRLRRPPASSTPRAGRPAQRLRADGAALRAEPGQPSGQRPRALAPGPAPAGCAVCRAASTLCACTSTAISTSPPPTRPRSWTRVRDHLADRPGP